MASITVTMITIFIYISLSLLYFHTVNALLKQNNTIKFGSNYNRINDKENRKFKVIRITPKNDEEIGLLNELYRNNDDLQLDFWKAPTNIGEFVDIMINPDSQEAMNQLINKHDLQYNVIINDVQRLIIQREKPPRSTASLLASSAGSPASSNPFLMAFFQKRMKDDPRYTTRNRAKYAFGEYHSYEEMLRWLDEIERFYPQMARVFTAGTTHENRPIRGIKIGNPIGDTTKRAVWIDGGMHAREWAAIHTALYFIEQLISLYGVDPKITSYVNSLNFYILPVANPDGFEYSRSDVTPQTRFWRKNRGNQICRKDRWRRERCCGGVDLNRNFDFHWGEIGSSGDLCSDIFQGTVAFSEPESRGIRDKILSPELNGKLDAFITLHTYSQMWIHPYNHERKSFPEDILELQSVGKQGVDAIESVYGTKFRFGTGADILYPSAGGSDDWAKAKAKVKFVYLLELRPGEEEWDGFLLDRRQLIPTGRETWEGVKVVIDAVLRKSRSTQLTTRPSVTTFEQRFFPTSIFLHTLATTPWTTRPWPTQPAITQPPATTTARTATFWTTTISPTFFSNFMSTQQRPTNTNNFAETISRRDGGELNSLRVQQHQTRLIAQQQQQLAEIRDQARRDYERRLQQVEQRRQLLFWQSQQNKLHSACEDRSQWCASWLRAAPAICQTSTVYMRQECQLTCNFCTPVVLSK